MHTAVTANTQTRAHKEDFVRRFMDISHLKKKTLENWECHQTTVEVFWENRQRCSAIPTLSLAPQKHSIQANRRQYGKDLLCERGSSLRSRLLITRYFINTTCITH